MNFLISSGPIKDLSSFLSSGGSGCALRCPVTPQSGWDEKWLVITPWKEMKEKRLLLELIPCLAPPRTDSLPLDF